MDKFFKRKFKQNIWGFTLIETLVALGIFGLVISMSSGIFVLAIVNQRNIIALRNVTDNIRFAVDTMSREVRTGTDFSGGGSSISFMNANGESVIYRLSGGIVEKSSDNGTSYLAVTSSETLIDYLYFYLIGQATHDGLEPRVTTSIGATSQVGNQSVSAQVQTTISERLLQN